MGVFAAQVGIFTHGSCRLPEKTSGPSCTALSSGGILHLTAQVLRGGREGGRQIHRAAFYIWLPLEFPQANSRYTLPV